MELHSRLTLGVIFILVCLYSCDSSEGDYKKELVKSGISLKFVEHFPNNPSKPFKVSHILKPKNDMGSDEIVTIYLECALSDSILRYCQSNAIAEYHFSDSCNVIPNILQKDMFFSKSEGLEWFYENWLDKIEHCEKRYPIPNFILVGEEEFKRKRGISDEYDLYVLKSESGKHFDEKYYGKEPYMPQPWNRGYSKGVAINNKTGKAIYWFIVW